MLLADDGATDSRVQEAMQNEIKPAVSSGSHGSNSSAHNRANSVDSSGRPAPIHASQSDDDQGVHTGTMKGSVLVLPVLAPATAAARQFARRTGTTDQLYASRRCLGVLHLHGRQGGDRSGRFTKSDADVIEALCTEMGGWLARHAMDTA